MYELQVEGMSCNHCISRVTKSVKEVDAAATVDVNLASKTVRIESTADVDDVCATLTEAGYPAKAKGS